MALPSQGPAGSASKSCLGQQGAGPREAVPAGQQAAEHKARERECLAEKRARPGLPQRALDMASWSTPGSAAGALPPPK